MLFSGMKKGLKSIDFYQAVASQHSQGTVSGACISVTLVITLCFLLILSINQFLTPRYKSDLIIDQKHLNEPLKVNIDIEFPRYACSMLSLDIENVLKVHKVNIGNTIKKYELPGDILYDDSGMPRNQKKSRIQQDFKSGKGCRMKGFFEVDRVPGNFHFSCHGYGDIIQQFINEGTYRDAHKMIDLSHIVHELTFGNEQRKDVWANNALKGFQTEKQIREAYLGISYTYFLDIMEENKLKDDQGTEGYFYTARLNEVILAAAPMVYFRYETNPMTVIKILQYKQYHELFVEIVGLVGGIFTLAIIIDQFVHSSIHFLMEKHRLGKLR